MLRCGSLVASGDPAEVLTPELVRKVFGVDATVVPHPRTGIPQLLYDLSPAPAGLRTAAEAPSEGPHA